jgi:hypothetical protein
LGGGGRGHSLAQQKTENNEFKKVCRFVARLFDEESCEEFEN